MSNEKSFGLSLSVKSRQNVLATTSSVFGERSDSEDEQEKPVKKSAGEVFEEKYGGLKARHNREVNKVLEEDANVYDYDGHYDELERRKEELKVINKKNDDGKPKYAAKLMKAKERRDLEKLIIEEKKLEREREEEGGEFDEKEAFVTGAYRKVIEEKEKIRKELEEEERINDLNNVKNASMWRETMAKNRLDALANERELLIKGPAMIKKEPEEETEQKPVEETEKRAPSSSSSGTKTPEDEAVSSTALLKAGLNSRKKVDEGKEENDRKRHDDRDRKSHRDHRDYERRHRNERERDTRHKERDEKYKERRSEKGSHRGYEKSRDRDAHKDSHRDKHREVIKERDNRKDKDRRERHHDSRDSRPSDRHRSERDDKDSRGNGQDGHSHTRERRRNRSDTFSPERQRSDSTRREPDSTRSKHKKQADKKQEKRRETFVKPSASDDELLYKEEKGTLSSRERQHLDEKRRMNKVRIILAHATTQAQLDEMTKRYFERRENGLIVPPLAGADEKIKY